MPFRYLLPEQPSPSDYEPPGAVGASTSAPRTTATGRPKGQCVVREVFRNISKPIQTSIEIPWSSMVRRFFFRLQCHGDAIGTHVGSWASQSNMPVMSRAKSWTLQTCEIFCIIDWINDWMNDWMDECMLIDRHVHTVTYTYIYT